MKIEQGNITITDIPVFSRIEVTPIGITLTGGGFNSYEEPMAHSLTSDEIEELRDALTAALDARARMLGEPVASWPRVFSTDALEPSPKVTKVRDCDGDIWWRGSRGWGIGRTDNDEPWTEIRHYAPLTEVR